MIRIGGWLNVARWTFKLEMKQKNHLNSFRCLGDNFKTRSFLKRKILSRNYWFKDVCMYTQKTTKKKQI